LSGRNRIYVMSFGLGGNSGDGLTEDGNTYSSSWYLNGPDEFVKLIPDHYDPHEVDGCLVIDKREVLEARPGLAYRAPMCNARLSEGEIDRFREIQDVGNSLVLQAFAQGDGQQRSLAALAAISLADQGKEPGPLDYVGPVAYAAWGRDHGARVGVLHCEPVPHIEWSDHQEAPCPPSA
jgi:hypothetical protein